MRCKATAATAAVAADGGTPAAYVCGSKMLGTAGSAAKYGIHFYQNVLPSCLYRYGYIMKLKRKKN
jgi:hypothetical protein